MKESGGKGEEGGGSEEEKGDGRVKDRGGGWGKLQWVALFSRRQRNFHFPDVCSDNTSLKMKIKKDKKTFMCQSPISFQGVYICLYLRGTSCLSTATISHTTRPQNPDVV